MRRMIRIALVAAVATGSAQAGPDERSPADEAKSIVESLGFERPAFATATRSGAGLDLSGMRASVGKDGIDGHPVTVRGVRVDGASETPDGRSYATVILDGMDTDGTIVEKTVFSDVTVPTVGKARYATVQARNIRSPSKDGESVAIEGILISGSDWRDGYATRGGFQIRGVSVSGGRAMIAAAFMPELPKSADIDATWNLDPDAGRLTLDDLSVWYGKVALLRGSFVMTGIDPKRLAGFHGKDGPAAPADATGRRDKAADAMAEIRLDTLSLRLENTGLVQSLLTAKGKLEGKAAEQVASDLTRQAEVSWPPKVGDPAIRSQALKAVRAFLADPRSLAVRMTPAPGGGGLIASALDVYMGKAGAASLGLAIEANRPERRAKAP